MLAGVLLAHAPDAVDGAWYNSLKVPGTEGSMTPSSCCGAADCMAVEDADVKIDDGVYFVRSPTSGQLLRVPPDSVAKRSDNPTGKYVACVHNERVLCFVLGVRT